VILLEGAVSAVILVALLPAVVRAALLTFVAVVAVLTHDEDRRKSALTVLRILASSRMTGPDPRAVLRNWVSESSTTTDEGTPSRHPE